MKLGIVLDDNALKGGISQYSFSLTTALSQLGEAQLVIFTKSGTYTESERNVETRRYEGLPRNFWNRVRKFWSIVRHKPNPACVARQDLKAFEDIDLIFCPVGDVYPHFFLKKPFVFTLHDLQEKHLPGFFSFKNLFGRHVENAVLLESCLSVLCESQYVRQDILRFFPSTSPEKVHVLPVPPFQTKGAAPSLDPLVPKQFGGKPYLFYPAQFWPHKNHLKLLKAFQIVRKEFPTLRLVCTGGHLYDFKKVKKATQKLGLNEAVSFPGFVSKETLVQLYLQAEMLVMPTLFESVSIPIYEAFSLGVPVCSSTVTALPEQVGDAGLLFDPLNEQDMAEQILRLLKDPELCQTLVHRGKEKMKEFTLTAFSENLAQLVSKLTKGDVL